MTTDLPSLSSGRSFIHRISKMAYTDLQRFGEWRLANAPEPPAVTDTSTLGAPAPDADGAQTGDGAEAPQDVPMWGATSAPASPAPAPAATP
jgi:hypothetical protein